jgi:hypothetical protein
MSQQKKLLTEIMEADSKDGLYKQQTAVKWLINELEKLDDNMSEYVSKIAIYNQAKAMEKEQIKKAYKRGYIDGVGETELANSVKNINKYI